MQRGGDDSELLALLRTGDQRAFELIYARFADRVYAFIYKRTASKEISEEILQELFVSLWTRREVIQIDISLEVYLFSSAKYKVLSYIRSEIVRRRYADDFRLFESERVDNSNEELQNLHDLEATIEKSLAELPERQRLIYCMSRQQHISIQKIAEQLNLTTKTVENNLSMALKHLRGSLGSEHLAVLILVGAWLAE